MTPDPKHKVTLLTGKKFQKFREEIYNRDNESCQNCGRWVPLHAETVFEIAHLTHIIPRKRGGDVPENVKIKCFNCHILKEHFGEKG